MKEAFKLKISNVPLLTDLADSLSRLEMWDVSKEALIYAFRGRASKESLRH